MCVTSENDVNHDNDKKHDNDTINENCEQKWTQDRPLWYRTCNFNPF